MIFIPAQKMTVLPIVDSCETCVRVEYEALLERVRMGYPDMELEKAIEIAQIHVLEMSVPSGNA